ncbi:MAG: RNA methyltransferase [Eubacteriaceae bacterium]|jgi:TrmH family RNA methyltransferase|nr:RNA methyltransferase [Eubacteriaceae bacterium]
MKPAHIESPKNPAIMEACSLKEKKYRDRAGMFLMEGDKFILSAIEKGHMPIKVFAQKLYKSLEPFDVATISQRAAKALSDTASPQSLYAVFEEKKENPNFEEIKKLLILDGIQDPSNVGTLIRSAVCAGYCAVLASSESADFYAPKTVRASAGSVLDISLYRYSDMPFSEIRNAGIALYAAEAAGESNFCFAERSALAVGSEGSGLSSAMRAFADKLISIPMPGAFDSLNAAVAGSILIFKSIGF